MFMFVLVDVLTFGGCLCTFVGCFARLVDVFFVMVHKLSYLIVNILY